MTTAFLTHPACRRHEMGADHPESPARLDAINDALIAKRLMGLLRGEDAPKAPREAILRVHTPEYLSALERNSPERGRFVIDPDTCMNEYTLEAAYHAAGAGTHGAELIMRGEVKNAFCSVRPPGHHALPAKAMGFCFFNNIAVAASNVLHKYGLKRVAICDFDVHHGNGTEAMFRDDERVLLLSVFQHPHYPGAPFETDSDRIINVTLDEGTRSLSFREAIEAHWFPALEDFAPEFIFVSAGFDGHLLDPLAGWGLRGEDYAWITRKLLDYAGRFARGRLLSTLEGGYSLQALSESVPAHVNELIIAAN